MYIICVIMLSYKSKSSNIIYINTYLVFKQTKYINWVWNQNSKCKHSLLVFRIP